MIYVNVTGRGSDYYDHWKYRVRLSTMRDMTNCISMTLFSMQGEERFYNASYNSVFDDSTIGDVAVLLEATRTIGKNWIERGEVPENTEVQDV